MKQPRPDHVIAVIDTGVNLHHHDFAGRITVRAVDTNNIIAAFSNRAGDARHHVLVAHGVNVQTASASD
jgi:creatinine amidohydrolase/Fe(II)-dependent formamide hydrolase-like protein